MHAFAILQELLAKGYTRMHQGRLRSLLAATRAALDARSHTLSNLARAMGGQCAVRHRVKRVDRLLGNLALQRECGTVYAALAQHHLREVSTPLILVDWTDLNAARSWQMIRASSALAGRSMTLYEEVHSIKKATSGSVHKAFLIKLKSMLPPGCQPIVITDAGFRSTWFAAVQSLGWHWVGRIRNRDMVRACARSDAPWRGCKSLYASAKTQAQDLGWFDYVRSSPTRCRLVSVKRAPKGRHDSILNGKPRCGNESRKQARAQSEPWLLAVSPSLEHLSAQAIVAVYAQRMQIEQAFGDTKNARLGLGMSDSATRTGPRLAVLALIACLAEFVLRLIGQTAMHEEKQYELQLTNRKSRPELSVFRLGQLLVNRALPEIRRSDFKRTLSQW